MRLPGLTIFFKLLGFILASWLLVHFLAIFGVFLVAAYPIWWLFVPQRTICFFCRSGREGSYCPACHQVIIKSEGNYIRTFRSSVLNSLMILALTAGSFGTVFLESRVLFKLGFPPTPKTVSFRIPGKAEHSLGEIFPMEIEIIGVQTPINAIQADVSFDPKIIEIVEISTKNSFANIFVQKEVNNEVGYGRLTGGLPNPGFFSDRGIFGTVYFKGKNPGVVKVEFLPSSMVLANDGRGTNVLKDFNSAAYLILPDRLTPEQIKQQEAIINPIVLGEQAGDEISETIPQMRFYEERRILGTEAVEKIQKNQTLSFRKIVDFFLKIVEIIDRFALTLWPKIIGLK